MQGNICVSIAEKTYTDIITTLSDCNFAEIRLDLTDVNEDEIRALFGNTSKKLIATCREGKYDEADALFTKLATDYPAPENVEPNTVPIRIQTAQAYVLFGRGKINQAKGDTSAAEKFFLKLKTLYPWSSKSLEADFGLAQAERAAGKYDEALAKLGSIIRAPRIPAELSARSMFLYAQIFEDQAKAATDLTAQINFYNNAIDNYLKIAQFYAGVPVIASEGMWNGCQLIEKQLSLVPAEIKKIPTLITDKKLAAKLAAPNFRAQQTNKLKAFYEQITKDFPSSPFAEKAKEKLAAFPKK